MSNDVIAIVKEDVERQMLAACSVIAATNYFGHKVMSSALDSARLNSPLTFALGAQRIGTTTGSELLAAHSDDGDYSRWTGQSWVVRTFTMWEHCHRGLLEEASGIKPFNVDVFGDLRLMRNDIVHNGGVASAQRSGRLLVLSGWVTVGEPLNIGLSQIAEFSRIVPWDELRDLVHAPRSMS